VRLIQLIGQMGGPVVVNADLIRTVEPTGITWPETMAGCRVTFSGDRDDCAIVRGSLDEVVDALEATS
jgi:uncharacterized protein YlzI (FlbEa/FlbD family)